MVAGLAGALLLITSTAWAVPAQAVGPVCSGSGGCVLVELIRGDGDSAYKTVALEVSDVNNPDLQDVFNSGTFTNRPAGADPTTFHGPGVSVRKATQIALGTDDLTTVDRAEVVRANGTSSDELSKTDLQAPGAETYPFPKDNGDPTPTPMFSTQSDGIVYGRPLRSASSDPSDTNQVQNTTYDSRFGVPLVVKVHLQFNRTLQPVVKASPPRVKLGGAINFAIAYADDQGPDGTPRYYWNFGDAGSGSIDDCSTTAQPDASGVRHIYKAKGTYVVTVLVCGATSSGESPNTFTVQVDPPKRSTDPGPGGPGPKHSPTRGPKTGPDDSDGNDQDGAASPTKGTGGSGNGDNQGKNGDRARQQQAAAGKKDIDRSSGGVSVSGVLLDADAARSVTIQARQAAPLAAAQARRGSQLPTDWRWLLALLPLTLLLGGVARQTPWLAGRLPRPPWRDV